MRKILFVIIILFLFISVYPADLPIIFLHGHKSYAFPWKEISGVNAGGWGSWNPQNADSSRQHPSSMTDIIDEHYGGYVAGNPLNCDKNSTLSSTNGNTKVMYNYLYYILQIYKNIL